jgi:Uma2 family endonuclease
VLPGDHLELVEGDLIDKKGKGRLHVITLRCVLQWLCQVFGAEFVNSEASIDVAPEDNPTNEPEPDLVVLTQPDFKFLTNPQPADVRLAVEISDSTLSFDLTTKATLYARAQITEYWVFDIPGRRLVVHRYPSEGKYQSVSAYSDQESVHPLAAPDHLFPVASAFQF